ncbi:MAG: transcriptional regulator NrdR [Candidatus Brocadiia bacterium]|nr:transcriptional regulator NrdR [Planctomycetota bacterium]
MRCPYCKKDDDRVVNSRTSANGATVKRRRECQNCGRRYTTYERLEESPLRIVKKDGNRETFSRSKLLAGLMKACHKRPVSTDRLEEVVDEIERQLRQDFDNEVPSDAIGELVMERLREMDQVAFIRFASVYREFKDVSDFVEEADMMLADGDKAEEPAAEMEDN